MAATRFVAATELAARGRNVRIMLLCKRDSLKDDAARAAAAWTGEVEHCNPAKLGHPLLIIDAAVRHLARDRDVKGDFKAIIDAINTANTAWAFAVVAIFPPASTAPPAKVMGTAIEVQPRP